ncbi:hypothetical protein D3C81_669560 [compost metagenome]
MEQGGDGAAGGEDGDVVAAARGLEHALQALLDPSGKRLPALQPVVGMIASVPALHHQCEQALKFTAVLRAIAQDVQGVGLFPDQPRQQGTDHAVGIELIERRVGLDSRNRAAAGVQGLQRQTCGILLAAQVTGHATIQLHTQLSQVVAQGLALTHTDG